MLEIAVIQSVGSLSWNYEELKANVELSLKKYNQLVTEETYADAKKDMANLNKYIDDITKCVNEAKQKYCAPYLKLVEEANELKKMINEARNQIATQVKAFDEADKQEKFNKITNFFTTLDFDLVDLNRIFNDKWLNKGTSDKKWQTELTAKVEQIKKDLEMINLFGVMNDDEKNTIKAYYLQTLDLTLAKSKYDELQALKKKVEQPRFIDTGEVVINDNPIAPEIERVDYAQEVEVAQCDPELYTRTFTVFNCTREQIIALGNYMNANGIKFEKVQ